MSNRNPFQEYAERIQRQVVKTRGGFPGGRPPAGGLPAAAIGFALLGGGAWFISNSLFNVDGGHRAIKYQRLSGVSKEIFGEGPSVVPRSPPPRPTWR